MTRLYTYLPRRILINIYKAFIRPHLDYGGIESIQYNAGLAIRGTIRGTS